jgi:DNA repair protein RecO (recombination protein O)
MGQTYKATGINLKSIPLGEADRVLTILTREHGLIRAVAPGSRKPKAKLGGRSELFVVNQLLLSKGRSLDRITQADSIESYLRLSRNLAKLTVSQYWAEIVLYQTPVHEPNAPLFDLLCERLADLANCDPGIPILIHLVYGMTQLLSLAGVTPQIEHCCITHERIRPETIGNGRVVFSPDAGGVVLPTTRLTDHSSHSDQPLMREASSVYSPGGGSQHGVVGQKSMTLSAVELGLMQQLFRIQQITPPSQTLPAELLALADIAPHWLRLEQILRGYVQYHTERTIRSASLLESCFSSYSVAV